MIFNINLNLFNLEFYNVIIRLKKSTQLMIGELLREK